MELAAELGKPLLHAVRQGDELHTATLFKEFLRTNRIEVLNVAGPRASEEPEVGAFVREVLEAAL